MSALGAIGVRSTDRIFYSGMALALAGTVFTGFARTYYLHSYFGMPAPMPLLLAHGAVFTSWLLLLVVQTSLVAANRRDIHRRLGIAGAGLAAVMLVLGTVVAIGAARRGSAPPGVPALAFLTVPLGAILSFGALVAFGIVNRVRSETHKRLMLLATISIVSAAIGRILPLDVLQTYGFAAVFALVDCFIIVGMAYDLATRRRIHPAYLWGGSFIVGIQVLQLGLARTALWHAFASWLVTL